MEGKQTLTSEKRLFTWEGRPSQNVQYREKGKEKIRGNISLELKGSQTQKSCLHDT